MSPKEKIVDRIAKLKAHAESAEALGSVAEAEAFAQMMQRLLTEHKLEMSDIEFANLDKTEPVEKIVPNFAGEYPDFRVKNAKEYWLTSLGQIVADAHYCQFLQHTGRNTFTLVGRRSDVKVAEFMIITLHRLVEKLTHDAHARFKWEVWKRDHSLAAAKGFRQDFQLAFVTRLKQRYDEEQRARAGTANGTQALVRLSSAKRAVEDFMAALRKGKEVRMVRSKGRSFRPWSEGARRGTKAADGVRLRSNAVEQGNAGVKALK